MKQTPVGGMGWFCRTLVTLMPLGPVTLILPSGAWDVYKGRGERLRQSQGCDLLSVYAATSKMGLEHSQTCREAQCDVV